MEIEEEQRRAHDFVWAIDPIDGTTNFINGFPLFAASIGILHRGHPVVGAIWCSTSHALRSGVYHARAGGALRFEGEPLALKANEAVRRHLAGEPRASSDERLPWDVRKTGSAAIECAFVAAGLLRIARFAQLNIWDIAGGAALVRATGGEVRTKAAEGWVTSPMISCSGNCSATRARLSDPMLLEFEDVALELARLAGAEITNALGRTLALRYKKSARGAAAFRDPVSEVDHTVEVLVTLERFEAKDTKSGGSGLRRWRQPVILGEPEAVEMLCRRHS